MLVLCFLASHIIHVFRNECGWLSSMLLSEQFPLKLGQPFPLRYLSCDATLPYNVEDA